MNNYVATTACIMISSNYLRVTLLGVMYILHSALLPPFFLATILMAFDTYKPVHYVYR